MKSRYRRRMTTATDLLVVTGPMRSGTTLLGDCLQSIEGHVRHPDLAFSDDSFVDIRHLSERLRKAPTGIPQMDPATIIPVDPSVVDAFYGAPFAAEFRNRILERCGRDRSTPTVGFKNTALLAEFRVLKEYFPETKMVVLIRDPRDAYISYLARARRNTDPGQEHRHDPEAVMNSMFLNAYVDLMKKNDPDVIFVKYENLVADTEIEIKKILKFANLEEKKFDWGSLKSIGVLNNSSFEINHPDDIITGSMIHRKGIGRHFEMLGGYDLYKIERLTDEAMRSFGYQQRTRRNWLWDIKINAEFLPSLVESFARADYLCPPQIASRAERFARYRKYTERYIRA